MRALLTIYLAFVMLSLVAQDTINTQRPSLTENSDILKKGAVQFENGVEFKESEIPAYSVFARFGTSKRLEIRASSDLRSYFPSAGLKIRLNPAKGPVPATALLFNYDLRHGISDVRLTASNIIGNSPLSYSLNAGHKGSFYGIALLGCTIFKSAGVFIEWMTDENISNTAHTGLTWMPTPRFQLDAYGGYDALQRLYAGTGFSWLLP